LRTTQQFGRYNTSSIFLIQYYIKKSSKKTSKNPTQKYHKKYNNPHHTLNILYSNLQATLTLPAKHPPKYNKPPPFFSPQQQPSS
jgi:hypothetical protein